MCILNNYLNVFSIIYKQQFVIICKNKIPNNKFRKATRRVTTEEKRIFKY